MVFKGVMVARYQLAVDCAARAGAALQVGERDRRPAASAACSPVTAVAAETAVRLRAGDFGTRGATSALN